MVIPKGGLPSLSSPTYYRSSSMISEDSSMVRSDQSTVKTGTGRSNSRRPQQEKSGPRSRDARSTLQNREENVLSGSSDDRLGDEALIRKLITQGLWSDNHQSLELVLNKIGNLMFTNDEELKTRRRDAIFRAGGHLAIVQAMRKFPRARGVQTQGCRSLANATWETSDFMEAISGVGGVDAIIDAMTQFSKDEVLQICGCCALRNLTSLKKIAKLVSSSGGLKVVAYAMKMFPYNANIQECGCWTIAHVCLSKENKKFIEKGSFFCLVGAAADNHLNQAEVITAARQATERLWGLLYEG